METNKYQNAKQLEEYVYITRRMEASRENGKLGGRPKKPSQNPPTTTTTNTTKQTKINYSPYFLKFWEKVVNKVSKGIAEKNYVKLDEVNQPYFDRNGREIITNASNVPYQNPNYTRINSVGRQWIFEYGLALVKEILGYVRGKYSQIPIPGSEVTLNQSDLIAAATSEKTALIERLRAYFESTSRKTLLQKKAEEGEAQNKTLGQAPMTIYIG